MLRPCRVGKNMDIHSFQKITLKEMSSLNVNFITVFSLSKVLHQQFIIPLVIYTQQTLSNLNQFWQNERKRIDLIKRPVMMVIMEILKALPLYQFAHLFVALHLVWFYNIGINLEGILHNFIKKLIYWLIDIFLVIHAT